jgi:signal transduction histidine kinase/ligand-binding sensor domain-containing protein/ActR/RegA family two-component response regulator
LLIKSQSKQKVEFNNYTTEHGLAHNSGNCFVQDKEGFLWIGSNGGLEKFDGYKFTVYKTEQGVANSLSNNLVSALFIDKQDQLWVGTMGGGVNKFLAEQDKFISYRYNPDNPTSISNDNISFITEDKNGKLWIGTKGGGINLFSNGKFHRFNRNNTKEIKSDIIHDFCVTTKGNLILGTEKGICVVDVTTNKFRSYINNPGDLDAFSDLSVFSMLMTKSEVLWIGTWRQGLYKYDLSTKKLEKYESNNVNPSSIKGNEIFKIFEDSYCNVWIGTEKGLHQYNQSKDNFFQYTSDPNDLKSLSDNYVRSIFEDKSGVLWIGTNNGGLNKYDLHRKKFKRFTIKPNDPFSLSNSHVFTIFEDSHGTIWIGTREGLDIFDKKYERFFVYKNIPGDPTSLSNNAVYSICAGKPDELWIATDRGLNLMNVKTGKFKSFFNNPNNKNSLSNDVVRVVHYNKKGIVWIGSWGGGLDKFEPEKNKFTNYPVDPENLTNNVVRDILEDSDGILWLGTFGKGLVKFDPVTEKMTYYKGDPENPNKLKYNNVNFIYQDQDKTLWVGTSGGGLSKFDTKKEIFQTYDVKNGLPSSEITGMLEDNNGNIWISTGKGISKFNRTDNIFTNFDIDDGLQAYVFYMNSYWKSKTGEMYFGGINGFNVFYPDSIQANPYIPPVMITDFQILNKSIKVGEKINGRVILDKSLYLTKEIRLSYKEYVFSIEFAALHYASPKKNKYQYMLQGIDNDWIRTDASRRFVTYTTLKPGKYVFKVKGSNNDGVWRSQPTELVIRILPPWWANPWFRAGLVIFIVTASIMLYRIRVKILKARQILLEEKVKERTNELSSAYDLLEEKQEEIITQNAELARHRYNLELLVQERTFELEHARKKAEESDKLKSTFLANMSHEIRTPMNAIVGFSSLLKSKQISEEDKEQIINTINSSCDSLLVLINDLLEISIIEADQVKIKKIPFKIDEVLIELENIFNVKKEKDIKIVYEKNHDLSRIVINNDSVRFKQIITNLLNNSLKFTDNGSIRFGYTLENQQLKFYVADTGIGISKEEHENVFNPFHKVDNDKTKFYKGTGLGLAICKKLVNLMGGEIWLNSEVGQGTTFYFTLPFTVVNYVEPKEGKIIQNINHDWSNLLILVAEDEPTNFHLVNKILSPSKAELIWAKNGKEAVDYVQGLTHMDNLVILMDIKMPVMDGIEALKQIKKINKKIPVIAVTAYAYETDKYEILKNEFNDYVVKPLKPEVLIKAINKFVKKD